MTNVSRDFRSISQHLPVYSRGGYAVVMKTVANTLKFEESEPAKFRLTVLEHTRRFGWQSASHAYRISRATIFRWRRRMDGHLISLIPTSTRPHHTRQMLVDDRMLSLLRVLRETYGNIGKEKLKPLLDAYGATKIGNIITRYHIRTPTAKRVNHMRKPAVFRRKYAPKGVHPGHCEMDGITVYFSGATYRFVSIIDVVTRYGWCQMVPTFSAVHTIKTLEIFQQHCVQRIHTIQTDNGSEFLGVFHVYLETQNIRHEFCYPRCPRINGVVERFNRTLQEECINRIIDLVDDKQAFKAKLEQYCIWYNEKRPHYALRYQTPGAFASQHI
jgi:transposase InsO family protein